jgi:hypothetical protein
MQGIGAQRLLTNVFPKKNLKAALKNNSCRTRDSN